MKTRRKRCLAACLVILLLCMMLMPLGALAEGTEVPKGYVDPITELDLTKGRSEVLSQIFGIVWKRFGLCLMKHF
jgi:hypothetical protein